METTTQHKKRGAKSLSDRDPKCANIRSFNTILPAHHREVLETIALTTPENSLAAALRLVIEHAEKTMPTLLK